MADPEYRVSPNTAATPHIEIHKEPKNSPIGLPATRGIPTDPKPELSSIPLHRQGIRGPSGSHCRGADSMFPENLSSAPGTASPRPTRWSRCPGWRHRRSGQHSWCQPKDSHRDPVPAAADSTPGCSRSPRPALGSASGEDKGKGEGTWSSSVGNSRQASRPVEPGKSRLGRCHSSLVSEVVLTLRVGNRSGTTPWPAWLRALANGDVATPPQSRCPP